ncbi:MAG: transcription elongation factor GreA [Clostridiales bacterium]|nr:transcription elongation factor GreA [Clostridiales bacterium]
MADKKMILTYAGLKELEDEVQNLKVFKRKDVAEKIKEARAQGDLSENAEYDAAKEEQAEIESRIAEIERVLKNAEVVDEDEVEIGTVNIGCRVKLFDIEFDEEIEYYIVGSTEADSLKNKISNESPVGQALIGAKSGDTIKVDTKQGEIAFKILEIQRIKR